MTQTGYFRQLGAGRILAFSGVALIAAGMLLGEIYAIFISHVANGVIRQSWLGIIESVLALDPDTTARHFQVVEDLSARRGRTMNAHSHISAFGLLALALSFLQPFVGFDAKRRRLLAIAFLCGAFIQSSGIYLSIYAGRWALLLADAGAVAVIVSILGVAIGLLRSPGDANQLIKRLGQQIGNRSGIYLLKSGLLLIFVGMFFGLVYSWQLTTHDEPGVYQAIHGTVEALSERDSERAIEKIARFKNLQSKIAITAAAHSHAVEFGFLMLLLALVQRYVMLSALWRLRWSRVLSVGAYFLPICVYFATIYGLRAAAFADISGGMVLFALLAMAYGIVRYTGAVDKDLQRVAK